MLLHDLIIKAAVSSPDNLAVISVNGKSTYKELDGFAWKIASALKDMGVSKGCRVAVWLDKSIEAIAAMQASLRLGAVYVPVDPLSPDNRVLSILADCETSAIASTKSRVEKLPRGEFGDIPCLCLDDDRQKEPENDPAVILDNEITENDIAYILYTSGSTGKPKGVSITHQNALAFINWAVEELKVEENDIFANHAPFHFDLSVLDLYAAFSARSSVFLIPESASYAGAKLVEILTEEKITIWYSVPAAIILMMDYGNLLENQELSLRTILFAGETFPIKHLSRLRDGLSSVKLLNLYGPSETNVCAYYEVKDIDAKRSAPAPIGSACSGNKIWAEKDDGAIAGPGEKGELLVQGPTVMKGYWGQKPHGDKPYRTGDIVKVVDDDVFEYVQRKDHMVKVRGHRIEMGDIENTIRRHPKVKEALVLVAGEGLEAKIFAFVTPGEEKNPPYLLEIKKFCAENLPRYMIIDKLKLLKKMPRTRNGKIDRQKLLDLLS